MGIPQLKERRLSTRRKLSGLMPGRLFTMDRTEISCRPVDVSRNGVGVLISEQFEPGAQFELHVSGKTVQLEVAWRKPDFGKKDLFRYGLITLDRSIDLNAVFEESGCFQQ